VTYVVLAPGLEREEPSRFAALLSGFAAGYTGFFSDDEAESTDEWRIRIAGLPPPQPIMRIVVAVERAGAREEVIGGAAAEYYRASGCVLISYLYVLASGAHRHRGHARALLAKASVACQALGPVRAVLAEAEWPEGLASRGAPGDDVERARTRLRFFARIGARAVQIDYVQPALGSGKQPVSHLRLLALPSVRSGSADPGDEGLRATLDGFLVELHAALAPGSGDLASDGRLRRLRHEVREASPLTMPLP
jgi:hypothetical protein